MQQNSIHVWKTGHPINETVTRSLLKGIPNVLVKDCQLLEREKFQKIQPIKHKESIAYGILRGTSTVFQKCNENNVDWWEVDRGYFRPSHFDGYYRISLKDMQCKYNHDVFLSNDRLDKLNLNIKDWQKNDTGHILICPPTDPIAAFYGIPMAATNRTLWEKQVVDFLQKNTERMVRIRRKDDAKPLDHDLDGAYCVITFNSNAGVDALVQGIPVIAGPHSVISSWNHLTLEDLERDIYAHDRMALFRFLSYAQFTLKEIEQGDAWKAVYKIQKEGKSP